MIAILATTLVTATFAAAPAFASIGAGNTLTKQKNYGKALAIAWSTIAANVQKNCISVASGPC